VIARGALLGAPIAALLLWGTAVREADISRIGGLGLLPALPITYYVGLGVLAVGFLVTVSRPSPPRWILATHVGVLILMVHGTTPLLYDEPRYAWVYKHLGVIDYIATHGAVDRSVDIYQNWPAFFALNAWLSQATGVAPLHYAAWAQVVFAGLFVSALLFALKAFTHEVRTLWTSAWIFTLANWVAQDYLAAQAFGFLLGLTVLGLCLRCAPPPALPRRGQLGRRWATLLQSIERRLGASTSTHMITDRPLPPRAALAVGAICYATLVTTHQLSPVMVLAAVALLALVRRVPPIVPLIMAGMEAGWLYFEWPFMSTHFQLLNLDPLAAAATRPVGVSPDAAMPGQQLVSRMAVGLTVLMAVLALLGLMRSRRSARWDRRLPALLIAPLLVVMVQPYGGEALFRAYLFALPWMSYLAALACAPSRRPRVPRAYRRWRLAVATAGIGTGLLFAYFGLELIARVPHEDVAAAQWLDRHAAPGASFTYLALNFPERPTARYALMRVPGATFTPALSRERAIAGRPLVASDVDVVRALARATPGTRSYFIVSRGELNYIRLYGLFAPGSVQRLIAAIRASPDFRLVYRQGVTHIWELAEDKQAAEARRASGGRGPRSGRSKRVQATRRRSA
jgi:hypothetical protein